MSYLVFCVFDLKNAAREDYLQRRAQERKSARSESEKTQESLPAVASGSAFRTGSARGPPAATRQSRPYPALPA